MNQQLRLFLGIPLPHKIVSKIISFQQKQTIENIRWTAKDNLHITLVFIGNRDAEELPRINQLISDYTASIKPFNLRIKEYEWAPPSRPYMIWLSFIRNQYFESICYDLHRILNVPITHETITPHITVARVKNFKNIASLNKDFKNGHNIKGTIIRVKTFILWQSILKSDGPQYIPLHTYNLMAAEGTNEN